MKIISHLATATLACHHNFFPENVPYARSIQCGQKSGMKNTNSDKFIFLIVSFAIVALVLNNISFLKPHHALLINPNFQRFLPPSPQQQQEAAARKAADATATERAKFLARYLNTGFSRTPGSEMLAVVVANEDGKMDQTVSTAFANHFKTNNVKIFTSFFTPEFVSDKLFASVFDGSTEVFNKLELVNSVDALLLARKTVQFSKTASLNNLITANMQLEVQILPIAGNGQNQSRTFTVNGAGFSQTEAATMAEDRLVKQIASDTNLSLNFSPN
jgi:hypothetical protein